VAERRHGDCEQPVALPVHRHGDVAELGAQRRVHLVQRLLHHREGCLRRPPPPADELDGDAAPLHLLRDLRARAVHDADLVAVFHEPEDAGRALAGDGTADLDDEPRHVLYSALMRT